MGEYRSTRGEKPPATRKERRLLRNRLLFWVVFLALAIWAFGELIMVPRHVPASGYATTSSYAEVRAPVIGRVVDIEHKSGDVVAEGDVLLRLDDAAERAQVAEAESEVERCAAELAFREAELLEQHRERTNRIEVAAITLDYARKRLEVTMQLMEKGLASSRDVMEDTLKVRLAEAEFKRLGETDFHLAQRQLAVIGQTLRTRQKIVERARVALEARTITAPVAGRVLRHTFYVGEVVHPDMVLYEIFGGDEHVLRLRVPERYATRIAVGQPVRAQLRTSKSMLRRHWLYGEVGAIRDAIQAEGGQTYRVIYCPYDPGQVPVPPGASADAQILVGRSSIWRSLFDM
ncbi:MAG: HlyD family efflux transporter periplasmic adaptor subunit [Lentisphaerae bacterium]|jgi:multidrug resistance efflux pump|nr:HlyD family efflux transporter periplasmic adaptor subunit [Lentisphaerota bacterium]